MFNGGVLSRQSQRGEREWTAKNGLGLDVHFRSAGDTYCKEGNRAGLAALSPCPKSDS
jgi:hypothetical protein